MANSSDKLQGSEWSDLERKRMVKRIWHMVWLGLTVVMAVALVLVVLYVL